MGIVPENYPSMEAGHDRHTLVTYACVLVLRPSPSLVERPAIRSVGDRSIRREVSLGGYEPSPYHSVVGTERGIMSIV